MESLEMIDDYFKGLLTEQQKREFEQRILSDPAFAEDLAFYLSAHDLVKEQRIAEKKSRFKELYEQSKTLQDQTPGGRRGNTPVSRQNQVIRLRAVAVAASVLVALFGGWLLLRHPDPQQLADRYIRQHLQTLSVTMSSNPDTLQLAIGKYNDQDFAGALQLLQARLSRDTTNDKALEYAGLVSLRLNQYDKALHYFQQLGANTALYVNPGLFYQSLTLMKRRQPGDDQKARQLLQQVVDRNLAMKEDAQQLLKDF